MISNEEQLQEYAKCLVDIPYAAKTYLETFDQTQNGYVPFQLFPRQKETIEAIENNRYVLIKKYRQAGITTTIAGYFAVKTSFHGDSERPEKILILANKQDTAQEVLQKVKSFLEQVPRWVWGQGYVDNEEKTIFLTDSKKSLKLPNGCEIRALATSRDALRGYTPTILIMDEAAHIEDGSETFGAAIAAMSTGGKIILNSTPNGLDALYYKTYNKSIQKKNKFKIVEMFWYEDPRYNIGLQWVKKTEDFTDTIDETEFTLKSFADKVQNGYKPTSPWYEDMCMTYNGDLKLIAQELDCSFIGSGGNVIDEENIDFQEKNNVQTPIRTEGIEEECWIWNEPEIGHQYVMGVDVSRGDSEDSSSIEVVDITDMKQVLQWIGKMTPDLLAELVYEYGNRYKAYTVVDITGGYGVTTVLKLLEMDYKLLHYDDPRSKILSKRKDIRKHKTNDHKVPGFNVGANRVSMIGEFERVVRTDELKIRSNRTTNEMKTFVYKNGRADHMDGFHDDSIMGLAMAIWVIQHAFKRLEKFNNSIKAMLNSYMVSNSSTTAPIPVTEVNNPKLPHPNMSPNVNETSFEPNKSDYQQYSWLFGIQR